MGSRGLLTQKSARLRSSLRCHKLTQNGTSRGNKLKFRFSSRPENSKGNARNTQIQNQELEKPRFPFLPNDMTKIHQNLDLIIIMFPTKFRRNKSNIWESLVRDANPRNNGLNGGSFRFQSVLKCSVGRKMGHSVKCNKFVSFHKTKQCEEEEEEENMF